MGFLNKVNRVWSGLDFWDKKENKQQRDQFAREDEEERKRREAARRKTVQVQPQRQTPQQAPSSDRSDPFEIPRVGNGLDAILNAPQDRRPAKKSVEDKIEKPQQSNWDKVRDVFDANTEADRYRRTVEEAKKLNKNMYDKGVGPDKARDTAVEIAKSSDVPHYRGVDQVGDAATGFGRGVAATPVAIPRILTGLGEGLTSLPSLGMTGVDWLDRKRTGREEQWGATQKLASGTESLLEHTFNPASRLLDRGAEAIAGEGNTGGYRAAQIGGEVIGAFAGVGVASGARATSKSNKITELIGPLEEALNAGRVDVATAIAKNIEKLERSVDRASRVANQLGSNNRVAQFLRKVTEAPTQLGRGNKPADEVVDVTGAVQDGSKVAPDAAKVEVAPGVFKSPTAKTAPTAPATPPASQLPTPRPPEAQPTTLPSPAPAPSPVTQGAARVPEAPQTTDPTIQKIVADMENKINEAKLAETPPARTPDSAPVETPIQKQSKEVAPGQVINPDAGVTTRQMTPEEMRANGMSEDAIANVMARRANPEAVKKQPESDTTREVDPEVARAEAQAAADAGGEAPVAERLSELRARSEAATTKEERGLLERLIRAEEQGSGTKVKAGRLEKARADLAAYESAPTSTKKPNVAQSKTTPVKQTDSEALDAARAKSRAKTVASEQNTKPYTAKETVDSLFTPGGTKTNPVKSELPSKPKVSKAADSQPAKSDLPSKPKKPTQAQLNKGAVDNTNKGNGKVSEAWKTKQRKAGATEKQINSAVEKVEGRKVEPTADEIAKAENRKKTNEEYKQRKAEAEAEGKTKEAAPRLKKEMAKQKAKEMDETVSYFEKHFGAQVKGFKIDEEVAKSTKKLEEYDESNIGQFVKDYLKRVEDSDDPINLFDGMALTKRLEQLRTSGKLTDDGLLGLADEVYQSSLGKISKSGQTQRIAQEIYKNIPAATRVNKKLDNIEKGLKQHNIDFKPTDKQKTELVELTDRFDAAGTKLTGLDGEFAKNLDDYAAATTKKQRDELYQKHKQLSQDYRKAQQEAVDSSLAFNNRLEEITPELPKKVKRQNRIMAVPDKIGNYLRMAMLSSPAGRVRDVLSTNLNVLDDLPVKLMRALTGRAVNTVTRSGKYVDSVGSVSSLKKGTKGAGSKLWSSWKGEYTLDEATGRVGTTDRSELLHKGKTNDPISTFGVKHSPKGSKWNIPKKLITTMVQGPTDATYMKYTEELYNLGKVEARSKGLTGKDAKRYADMFMESPTELAQKKAAQEWLENSGMQKNAISKKLTEWADSLDRKGSKKYKKNSLDQKVKIPTAERFAVKSLARAFRTTTIPFVQYTGGSTHAMFMRQNPLNNAYQVGKAAWQKDPQKVIDEMSRGTWNTTKIGALAYAIEKNWIETSDTDADGKSQYNGPYLVKTNSDGKKEYIPAGTLGIAGGAALIGGHAVNKFFKNIKDDPVEAMAAITSEAAWNTVKASGLNNMLTGSNIFGGAFANAERVFNSADKTATDAISTIGAGLIGDIGSQAVPAATRDLNTRFDQNENLNPAGEKPDLSGKDPLTGRVNPWKKAYGQVAGGIPVISQTQFPRKSGELARGFNGRVLNANTQSEQQKAEIEADKQEEQATIERGKSLFEDDNLTNLLSEETLAIHNKYKGDVSKASEDDMDTIWKDIKGKKDTLIDDGNYDSYASVLQHELDAEEAEGGLSNNDRDEAKRDIGRAKLAGKNDVDSQIYRLYTGDGTAEGGGISQTELNKMMDPDEDVYDPDTAMMLLELDELMTGAGLSANSNGMNPWTRPKYREPKNGWGGSGSGSGKKTIATDFGSIAGFAKASGGSGQTYKSLQNSMPNLTKQSSKTNLKKKISVQKGVRL